MRIHTRYTTHHVSGTTYMPHTVSECAPVQIVSWWHKAILYSLVAIGIVTLPTLFVTIQIPVKLCTLVVLIFYHDVWVLVCWSVLLQAGEKEGKGGRPQWNGLLWVARTYMCMLSTMNKLAASWFSGKLVLLTNKCWQWMTRGGLELIVSDTHKVAISVTWMT